jgi:hypothetical protein
MLSTGRSGAVRPTGGRGIVACGGVLGRVETAGDKYAQSTAELNDGDHGNDRGRLD